MNRVGNASAYLLFIHPLDFSWLKVDDETMMICHMRERARRKYLNTEKLHVKNTDARIKLS